MIKKPWVEKYRPTSIQDVVFTDDRTESRFKQIVETGELPNLLLYGPPGTGKTSLSKALIHDLNIDSMDRLRINCSDEKIDAMREKVRSFAQTMPIGKSQEAWERGDRRPDFKVVQLEEFDYLSQDAQALLRSLMEETSGSTRFIATCNYINKVIPPLRSRFQEFELRAPDQDKYAMRLAEICEKESVDAEAEDIASLMSVAYPDMRKAINLLQQHVVGGKLVLSATEVASDWKLALLPLLETGDFKAARKLVCESASREELQDIYRFLYTNIGKVKKLKGKEGEAVVLIAQYQYQHGFVADPEIQVAALFVELGAL